MSPFDRHGITHLSPSSLNCYAEQPAFWALKYLHGYKDDGNPAMWRGSAVEAGLDHWLFKHDERSALSAASDRFELDALGDLSDDVNRERERVPALLSRAMLSTSGLGPPTVRQLPVEFWFDGIEVPIVGRIDYEWEPEGIDLKTVGRNIPTKIPGGHARQISLYQVARKKPYRILYVSPTRAEFKALTDDEVKTNIQRLEWHAHAIRRVLSMFSDRHELARIFVPDFDHFYWRRDEARVAATEIWQ